MPKGGLVVLHLIRNRQLLTTTSTSADYSISVKFMDVPLLLLFSNE